jgi:hypothetical protein
MSLKPILIFLVSLLVPAIVAAEAYRVATNSWRFFLAATFEAIIALPVPLHYRSPQTNHHESIIRIDSPRFADRV